MVEGDFMEHMQEDMECIQEDGEVVMEGTTFK
jgi:hypothetical protein